MYVSHRLPKFGFRSNLLSGCATVEQNVLLFLFVAIDASSANSTLYNNTNNILCHQWSCILTLKWALSLALFYQGEASTTAPVTREAASVPMLTSHWPSRQGSNQHCLFYHNDSSDSLSHPAVNHFIWESHLNFESLSRSQTDVEDETHKKKWV